MRLVCRNTVGSNLLYRVGLGNSVEFSQAGMNPFLVLVICCAVGNKLHFTRAQQNIFDHASNVLLGAAAKGKEIIDHGVNVKSDRQNSYDFFGLKLGTNNGINSGFGDAATEATPSSAEDDLTRKKRSLDLLRPTGILANSAFGANVYLVTINSVINVNNYGVTTEASATESSKRKRHLRLEDDSPKQLETISDAKDAFDEKNNKMFKFVDYESPQNDKFIRDMRSPVYHPKTIDQKKYGFEHEIGLLRLQPSETQSSDTRILIRSRRSPQESSIETEASTGKPADRPRAERRGGGQPPNTRRRKHHGGPCKKRGLPSDEDVESKSDSPGDDMTSIDSKRKREITEDEKDVFNIDGVDLDRSYSDYSSEVDSTHKSSDEEYVSYEVMYDDEENKKAFQRNKRPPCGRGGNRVTSTAMPANLRRGKRDVLPEEGTEKPASWFSTVLDIIVTSAKQVAAVTRKVFTRDKQGEMEENPDAEKL
ncbi:uncharacterized protein LOC131427372 [Malaya genurostris]|uniref:uncharacterized protein LOC131427372 n=1 Tax=Malaya genurostris TaxID=325434 RepID=UPI0026F3D4E4|nr:uncharacterized protein LOC131427372 [Malaya genurostris]